MQCYLTSNTGDTEITNKPFKLKDATLITNTEQSQLNLQTRKALLVLNGFALEENSTYTLVDGDILTCAGDKMSYTARLLDSGAPTAKRFKADGSKKITSFFGSTTPKTDISTPFTQVTGTWNDQKDHLVFTPDENKSSSKIAAFDMDGTLIKPKSGKKFPENFQDWMLLFKSVPKVLLEYYNKEFKLVIFSNQLPVGSDSVKQREFKEKIENILNTIKLPMHVFVATQKNMMRKPCIGMWEEMCQLNGEKVDKTESFYVGDAAGRPKTSTTPKDHSFVDVLFAKNNDIKFLTPEEFFMNAKIISVQIPFEPKVTKLQTAFTLSDSKPEVIIMVGAPASGKSTFCKRELIPEGYVHVSRDLVGSWQKCVQLVTDALKGKKRVVVDNTNKDKESRKRFIDVAKSLKVPCRCFYFKVEKLRAMHNNKYRELIDEKHVPVTDIIIHSHYKSFEEPKMDEGFDDIVELSFVPEFKDADYKNKALYEMFLLEKF